MVSDAIANRAWLAALRSSRGFARHFLKQHLAGHPGGDTFFHELQRSFHCLGLLPNS
jgi:hypothetical protein